MINLGLICTGRKKEQKSHVICSLTEKTLLKNEVLTINGKWPQMLLKSQMPLGIRNEQALLAILVFIEVLVVVSLFLYLF